MKDVLDNIKNSIIELNLNLNKLRDAGMTVEKMGSFELIIYEPGGKEFWMQEFNKSDGSVPEKIKSLPNAPLLLRYKI